MSTLTLIQRDYFVGQQLNFHFSEITLGDYVVPSYEAASIGFFATFSDPADPDTPLVSLTKTDMQVNDNIGEPFVSFSIDTSTLDLQAYPVKQYVFDFWLEDATAHGKQPLAKMIFRLRESVTKTFT